MDFHSSGYIIPLLKTTIYAVYPPHAQTIFFFADVLYKENYCKNEKRRILKSDFIARFFFLVFLCSQIVNKAVLNEKYSGHRTCKTQ